MYVNNGSRLWQQSLPVSPAIPISIKHRLYRVHNAPCRSAFNLCYSAPVARPSGTGVACTENSLRSSSVVPPTVACTAPKHPLPRIRLCAGELPTQYVPSAVNLAASAVVVRRPHRPFAVSDIVKQRDGCRHSQTWQVAIGAMP
jgi:hypothetical protein